MLKIGIIGFGRIGRVHAQSIQTQVQGAEVKRIADPYLCEEQIQFASRLGIRECSREVQDILKDQEIQAVLICSSTPSHAALSMAAAQAGKHVFCEKPIAADPQKIREVIQTVKECGIKFQVGFNRRFDHNFKALRQAVAEGTIGSLRSLAILSRDPEPPGIEYVRASGGMFLDMTIHDFDMARYLSGSEVKEVYAAGAALINPALREVGDIDSAEIILRFDNGVIGTISNSRQAAYGYDQRAEVFGSLGSAATQNDTANTMILATHQGVTAQKPLYFFLERYMASFAAEIQVFVSAVENDQQTPVSAEDGLVPVLIALAARRSLLENRPVRIAEVE